MGNWLHGMELLLSLSTSSLSFSTFLRVITIFDGVFVFLLWCFGACGDGNGACVETRAKVYRVLGERVMK